VELDTNAITLAVIAIMGSAITALITYFLTRKKSNADTDNVQVLSSKEAVAVLRESMTELRDEVRALRVRVDALELDNDALTRDKRTLAVANEQLTADVASLRIEVAALTVERDHFRGELSALQQIHANSPAP
jgi:chromosome segregation ATPase